MITIENKQTFQMYNKSNIPFGIKHENEHLCKTSPYYAYIMHNLFRVISPEISFCNERLTLLVGFVSQLSTRAAWGAHNASIQELTCSNKVDNIHNN